MLGMIRIAHISDLHFSKFSYSPIQFFSKRWLGNLNLLLNRSKQYLNERPFSLIPEFIQKEITHVVISGDLTTTSTNEEYKMAKRFVDKLQSHGMKVFCIPGNHDHYTKKSDRSKLFYQFFPSPKESEFSLKTHGVCALPLAPSWHLVLMDTSLATSLVSSNGYFSKVLEENLKKLLEKIPKNNHIILVNHYPFLDHDLPRRRLIRGDALKRVVQTNPNIQMYLHGHTHRHTIADLRSNHLSLILNSGSSGHIHGSWNLLELKEDSLKLTPYRYSDGWQEEKSHDFSFTKSPWYKEGLRFKCTGCGKCCTGPGFVWLEEEDVENISKHLNLSKDEFFQKYTRQTGFDTSLIDDPKSENCIFLSDQNTCDIYQARPLQCRTFPWWKGNLESPKAWEEAKERCEGIDHEEAPLISLPEIEKHID